MRRTVWFVAGFILLLLLFAACSTSVSPTPVLPTTVPPASAPPSGVATAVTQPTSAVKQITAGELATRGTQVYQSICAACHEGVAPKLASGLQMFKNAGEMYDYARTRMPKNNPGSLKPDEYASVIVKVLVEAKLVAADTPIDITKLSEIKFGG